MNPYQYLLTNFADTQTGHVNSLIQCLLQVGAALNLTTSQNPVTYVRTHLHSLGANVHAIQRFQDAFGHFEQKWDRGER